MEAEPALAYLRRVGRGDRAKKALGQNYLIDDALLEQMAAAAAPTAAGPVLEIGPGLGLLTRLLLRRQEASGGRLWAAEIDEGKVAVLEREFAGRPLSLLCLDARTVLLRDLWGGEKGAVCGNLPYYIANPLLRHFLRQRDSLTRLTVMVQKEVGERLTAPPGGRPYGLLSLAVRLYAEPEFLFTVPAAAFRPAPRVTSAAVRLHPRPYPGLLLPEEDVLAVARAAFAQRRKTALNSLSAVWPRDKDTVRHWLRTAAIPPEARAEQLTIEDFQNIALTIRRDGDS
ncbi:MAG: 16S rRNA (adenine(1518)-N(6)/adenine(1519)-N(6))-dimethyltransferase RsmA [Gracilibacteraceae bacterium]|jgi:16S rRNA (adenine1518-N6/adenine1519-N6)-dimethyltransferase|nr:16S rRNA (adenine(1518)-N(6)/adenine(1519)-N(6))-dimethyltransferase RsmA [Gracilibacteraceae bacterium]